MEEMQQKQHQHVMYGGGGAFPLVSAIQSSTILCQEAVEDRRSAAPSPAAAYAKKRDRATPTLLESSITTVARATTADVTPTTAPVDNAADGTFQGMNLEQLRARARNHVADAIEMIPLPEKAAYLEAMKQCPQLVAKESDPLQFIRCCRYNVWEAATRLARYWSERRDLFGDDRAFLPLDSLSGRGALNDEDILTLKSGFPALLPKNAHGQHVCFNDRRRHTATGNFRNRLRALFYVAMRAARDDTSQTKGVIVLVLHVTPRLFGYDSSGPKWAYRLGAHAFPLISHVHLLICPPKAAGKRYAVQDLITTFLGQCVVDSGFCPSHVQVHIEREGGLQLVEELQQNEDLALSRDGIPDVIGGTWTFDRHYTWCLERAEEDCRQETEAAAALAAETAAAETSIDDQSPPPAFGNSANAACISSEGEQSNSVQPQQQQQQQQQQRSQTQQQVSSSNRAPKSSGRKRSRSNNNNNNNNSSSNKLHHDPSEEDVAQTLKKSRRRASNMLHSRLKRDRRRRELECMKLERDRLDADNKGLILEHERLQGLLNQAQDIVSSL